MFIRRGFYKLKFEVEGIEGPPEVNMVDVHKGNDGNGDAQNGGGNNGNGQARDMDHMTGGGDDTSNNNDFGESNGINGGHTMQEKLEHFAAIKIGSLDVTLSPTGTPNSESILSKKRSFFKPLLYAENRAQNDKVSTVFGADSMLSASALGSYPVGHSAVVQFAAIGQRCGAAVQAPGGCMRQGEQGSGGQSARRAEVHADAAHCQDVGACKSIGHGAQTDGSSALKAAQISSGFQDQPQKIASPSVESIVLSRPLTLDFL
jgi:hypothetical protein